MKRLVLIILLLSSFFVYSAPIKVGILEYAPPYSSKADDNHYFGFIIDLMDVVCVQLERECVFVTTPLGSKYDALQQGKIDISFDPSPINTNIPDGFIFSLPFLASHGQFVALKDSNIRTIKDIKNKKIGVLKFTLFESFILMKYNFYNEVVPFDSLTELINAFIAKKVDLIMLNYSFAHYLIYTTSANFRLVGNKIPIGNGYGILALKTNTDLIDQINHILLDMEEDGSYLKIYNRYFGE